MTTLDATQLAPPATRAIVRAQQIRKSFGGVRVLDGVDFDLLPGEVHALLGENGAGKSTLLKILAGVHRPDDGEVFVDDQPVHLHSPHDAQRLGIALIHQEPLTFPDLDVAENIYSGHAAPRNALGLLDRRAMLTGAKEVLAQLGVKINPRAKLRGLSIADQQMVELAAALSQRARVLLMDEPTAALTPGEVADLFRIVRRLRGAGTAIVFISHRLEEVFELADRITVLRDGQFVATRERTDTSPQQVIAMMVGRDLGKLYEKEKLPLGSPRLTVKDLSSPGRFADISFNVRAGEIVGLAGLVGAGRTDVAQAIFGALPLSGGQVEIDGKPVTIASPRQAIDRGLAYVPEDRQHDGLLLPFSIANNTTLANLAESSCFGWLRRRREREIANRWRERLAIRLRSIAQPARELSGGNQQKVVLGKWLHADPQVLILDEPTRGIDIGAKAEVHKLMVELARQGKSILMISSDLPEVLAMSDRVLVMREGRLTGEFTRAEATQERIMSAATGQRPEAPSTKSQAPDKSQITSTKTETGVLEYASVRRRAIPSGIASWLAFRELGIALFLVLAVLVAWIREPRFLSADNLRDILLYIPLILVVAMGQMMVVITRNIDLSVGSVLGLAAIIVGGEFVKRPDFSLPAAAVLAILIGALAGAVNGVLVSLLRVPAIIATLGTMTAYRGLVFIYSGGRQVDNNYLPESLIRLSQSAPPLHVPWIVIFVAAVACATWLLLRYTRSGREVYAIGSNPTAAALRGVNVSRNLLLVFTITGALSGIAGLMYASRFGYVNPVKTGQGFELIVISAVIIGGTNVFGGSGSVLGVVLGCLMIGVVAVALPVLHISQFWQLALYGLAILVAATADGFVMRRLGRFAGANP
jgi:ABC-type sugar transport system ATPase subunit/ribose/xylose/arabinose/galactoside ABC-type transport system permease subunit